MDNKIYLFVYGSLKRGKDEYSLIKTCEYVGKGYINGILYDLCVGFPAAVETEYKSKVYGEVYIIDKDTLDIIDEYEDYKEDNLDESVYYRKEVDVYLESPKKDKITAYTYFLTEERLSEFFTIEVKKGVW